MERIKVEVQAQNKQMTNSAKALKDALVVAVNTEGLREKNGSEIYRLPH